jgi:hypothetical protein
VLTTNKTFVSDLRKSAYLCYLRDFIKIFKKSSKKRNQKPKISKNKSSPSKMDSNFNNFFQQQLWGASAGGGGGKNLPRTEITSSDKNTSMSGQSSSSSASSILAPSKLAQTQPPHSTNRDLTTLSLDNRLQYLDGLRHHHHHQQQQHPARHGASFGSMSIGLSSGASSRDNNNNGLNNSQSMGFAASQKLLNRLDIDTIRSNVNRNAANCSSNSSMMHHQHGTILFNTLNGGLGSAGMSDCFNSSDYGHPDSTTPPPTAISMPPPASSASSSSSTISTNLGLNRSSNGSQDGNPEKVKTPNSIRGELFWGL